MASPSDMYKGGFDFDSQYKHYESKKLKGFVALYYHYLYLFGKIKKKQVPQRVSFYLRDEIVKLERYQKQFKFLYNNNIETVADLTAHHRKAEARIDELTTQRKLQYIIGVLNIWITEYLYMPHSMADVLSREKYYG